jgi:hypothetical protein
MRADLAILPAAFNSLIGILVKIGKVLPQFFVSSVDNLAVLNGSEFGRQVPDGGGVEFVLMRLQVSKLSKLLSAIIKATEVGFGMIMDDSVGTYVSALSEAFTALFALVWPFSSVSSFMCL